MAHRAGQYQSLVAGRVAVHTGRGPMRSVPPRGSGWVSPVIDTRESDPPATREVVLTSWDRSMIDCERDHSIATGWDSKTKDPRPKTKDLLYICQPPLQQKSPVT